MQLGGKGKTFYWLATKCLMELTLKKLINFPWNRIKFIWRGLKKMRKIIKSIITGIKLLRFDICDSIEAFNQSIDNYFNRERNEKLRRKSQYENELKIADIKNNLLASGRKIDKQAVETHKIYLERMKKIGDKSTTT